MVWMGMVSIVIQRIDTFGVSIDDPARDERNALLIREVVGVPIVLNNPTNVDRTYKHVEISTREKSWSFFFVGPGWTFEEALTLRQRLGIYWRMRDALGHIIIS